MSLGRRHARYSLTADVVILPMVGAGLIVVALIAALLGSLTFNQATLSWTDDPLSFAAIIGTGLAIGGGLIACGAMRFVGHRREQDRS